MANSIGVLGNCQAGILASMINDFAGSFTAEHVVDSARTGPFTSDVEAADRLETFDVLIYQPTSEAQGAISDAAIRGRFSAKPKLTFPYVFNSGVTTLGYATASPRHSYGEIYGEAIVEGLIRDGLSLEDVIKVFWDGDERTNPMARLRDDLRESSRREANVDIKLTDFIESRLQDHLLFVTHNHPSRYVFEELFTRLDGLLNFGSAAKEKMRADAASDRYNLPYTGAPYSPHDVKWRGYRFGWHSDWRQKQEHLIRLVWRRMHGEMVRPSRYVSSVVLPDCR